MKIHIILTMILFFSWVSLSDALTMEELTKACENKTIVYNKKGEVVGYRIDGYCSGYLLGVIETLALLENNVCLKKEISPEYLLSVLQTYIEEKGAEKTAQETLKKAFERAFICD